ncbi:MAG: GFA family protein [Pseudomonadales bacterium]
MPADQTYSGGCLCEAVRFTATAGPLSCAICHCRSCQRASGAESVGWATFPAQAVTWSGELQRSYQSSPGVERTFCQRCGSTLSYQASENTIDLVLACLDDPEAIPPQREIWLAHRISWNALNPALPTFAGFSKDG